MKFILNTIVLLEIISVMCVSTLLLLKITIVEDPSQNFSILHRKMTMTVRRQTGGVLRRTWPPHGLGEWEVPAGYKFSRQRGRRRR